MLGGTTTSAAINVPGLFHAWGRQVIAGIGWQLVNRAVQLAGDRLPDFSLYHRAPNMLQVRVNAPVYAALLDEAVLGSGATLALHTMLAAVDRQAGEWRVTLCGKEGLRDERARVLVDCTGDANAVALAGFGLERNEELQPGTLNVRLSGYDPASLDYTFLDRAYEDAVAAGSLLPGDLAMHGDGVRTFLRQRGENSMNVTGIDASTSAGRTAAEVAAREVLMRIYRFLRGQPGLENLTIDFTAAECGIRESCTIRGKSGSPPGIMPAGDCGTTQSATASTRSTFTARAATGSICSRWRKGRSRPFPGERCSPAAVRGSWPLAAASRATRRPTRPTACKQHAWRRVRRRARWRPCRRSQMSSPGNWPSATFTRRCGRMVPSCPVTFGDTAAASALRGTSRPLAGGVPGQAAADSRQMWQSCSYPACSYPVRLVATMCPLSAAAGPP